MILVLKVRLENAYDFVSQTFINYCLEVGFNIEHPVETCSQEK